MGGRSGAGWSGWGVGLNLLRANAAGVAGQHGAGLGRGTGLRGLGRGCGIIIVSDCRFIKKTWRRRLERLHFRDRAFNLFCR